MNGTRYSGTAWVDGRRLHLESIVCQARLRITMSGPETGESEALGSVIGLDSDTPGLRVCAPLHVEWAVRNSQAIVDEAVQIWDAVRRDCEG